MTLVELMIAMAIGLMLMAGITTLIVQQSATRTELENSSRQIENGRYAAQVLRDDIQLAGYYGEFYQLSTVPAALPDPCNLDHAALETLLTLHVQGYDAPASVPEPLSECLPSENHIPGTDILVVRRADTTTVPVASAAANPNQVYLQTGIDPVTGELEYKLNIGSNASQFNLQNLDKSTAALRKFLVHIYFLSPCNTMADATCADTDDGGNPIPTLKRLESGVVSGAAGFTLVPLVEGIENMQLDYGLDDDAASRDGAPDSYVTDPTSPDGWSNAMVIRINLLARNNVPSPTHKDTKTYNLGLADDIPAANDNYKRHVFSQVVRMTNPSGRRDK